jgi:hypothetical protein
VGISINKDQARKCLIEAVEWAKSDRPVPVECFIRELRNAGISRGFLVVMHKDHRALPKADLIRWARDEHQVTFGIFESATDLLLEIVQWTSLPVKDALNKFSQQVATRLHEIEVDSTATRLWQSYFVK